MQTIIENILAHEVHFHDSKSGGPGGQNVNKTNTKMSLYFNIQDSRFLTDEQKARLIELAGHKVHHHESVLIMTCQEERHQHANKNKVIKHFAELLMKALVEPKKRIPMSIPKKEREARILDKKFQGKKKQDRQKPTIADSL